MVFDVLSDGASDLRSRRHSERRTVLEQLDGMTPPLQVVPGTPDATTARRWLEDYSAVDVGIEGLVIKGRNSPYQPGARGWLKYKFRDTVEAIIGAVIGTPESADRLILGQYAATGELRIVGSSGVLGQGQRRELREHLMTAEEHPWPVLIPAGRLGHWAGGMQEIHRVEPTLVVEVSADRAFDRGHWRHLTRYLRLRLDLGAQDIAMAPPADV